MYGPASGGYNNQQQPTQVVQSHAQRGGVKLNAKGHISGGDSKTPVEDLPPHIKAMFAPRPMPSFAAKDQKKEYPSYSGVGSLLSMFETAPPAASEKLKIEVPSERRQRIKKENDELHKDKVEMLAATWDPHANTKATGDAFGTLFVSRLSFDTTEKKLRREFEQFGKIKSLRIVTDLHGKSRGYGFVEFEREDDLKVAYKDLTMGEGRKLDGARIIVDVERGRTVKNWRPRRFGGGLGGRNAKKSKRQIQEEEFYAAQNAATAVASSGDRFRGSDRGGGDRGGRDRDRGSGGGDRGGRSDRPGIGYGNNDTKPNRGRSRSRSRDRGDNKRGGSRDRGGRQGQVQAGSASGPAVYGPNGSGGGRGFDRDRGDRRDDRNGREIRRDDNRRDEVRRDDGRRDEGRHNERRERDDSHSRRDDYRSGPPRGRSRDRDGGGGGHYGGRR